MKNEAQAFPGRARKMKNGKCKIGDQRSEFGGQGPGKSSSRKDQRQGVEVREEQMQNQGRFLG